MTTTATATSTTTAAAIMRNPVIFTASLDDGGDYLSLASADTIHVQKKEELCNNSSEIEVISSLPYLTLGEANVSCVISLLPNEEEESSGVGRADYQHRRDCLNVSKVNSSSVIFVNRFIFGINAISIPSIGRFTLDLQNCHSPVFGPLRSTTPPISFNVEIIAEGVESPSVSTNSGSKRLPTSFIVGNFILQPLTAPTVTNESGDSLSSHVSDGPIIRHNILRQIFIHSSTTGNGIFYWFHSLILIVLLCFGWIFLNRKRRRRAMMIKPEVEFEGTATCPIVDGINTEGNNSNLKVAVPICNMQRWVINQEKRLSHNSAASGQQQDLHGMNNDFVPSIECSSSSAAIITALSNDIDDNRYKIIEGPKHTLRTSRGDFVVDIRNGEQHLGPSKQNHSHTISTTQIDHLNLNNLDSYCNVDESVWNIESDDNSGNDNMPSTSGRRGGGVREKTAGFHPFKALSMTNEDWRDTFDKIYKCSNRNSNEESGSPILGS